VARTAFAGTVVRTSGADVVAVERDRPLDAAAALSPSLVVAELLARWVESDRDRSR
jgi:hypothetical protein